MCVFLFEMVDHLGCVQKFYFTDNSSYEPPALTLDRNATCDYVYSSIIFGLVYSAWVFFLPILQNLKKCRVTAFENIHYSCDSNCINALPVFFLRRNKVWFSVLCVTIASMYRLRNSIFKKLYLRTYSSYEDNTWIFENWKVTEFYWFKIIAYISINSKKFFVELSDRDLYRWKAYEEAYHVCKYSFKIRRFLRHHSLLEVFLDVFVSNCLRSAASPLCLNFVEIVLTVFKN